MTLGFIRYDDSNLEIIAKLWRAAKEFKTRFGADCQAILVNTGDDLPPEEAQVFPFQVRVYSRVNLGSFWIIRDRIPIQKRTQG